MNNNGKYVLGLDIGISSVGWGIIDTENEEIIDAGVRLFTEAAKENNENRRSFRGSRRLIRRRESRRKELINLLKEKGIYQYNHSVNPYKARLKGINEKLSNEELTSALIHICKHRGSSLEMIEDEEVGNKETSPKFILSENDNEIRKGKFVVEIQLDKLKKDGHIRGIKNNFRSKDYEKEVKQILLNQSLDEEINDLIIQTIFRRRHYSEGPGSFKSQTKYGRSYDENGNVILDMIGKMRGKCSIYKNEFRAPKLAPSAEFFNLLNDLNNLRINDNPIDVEIKKEIVKICFYEGGTTPTKISKALNIPLTDIEGFRIDKSKKPLITKLEGFKAFKKIFEENGKEELLKDFKLLDRISEILTSAKTEEERSNILLNETNLDKKIIGELSVLTKFTGYHSLSLKAIYYFNDLLYNSTKNQMQLLSEANKLEFDNNKNQKDRKKIGLYDEAILSPVALRAYRQAIKVVNQARKEFGEFESIVVETTRDKNSSEQKKRINDLQKYYEDLNNKVLEEIKKFPDVDPKRVSITKVRLYLEQDGKSAYTQKPIDLERLIRDDTAYEIDHIIPLSISLDDSFNNKALVTREENQLKGQTTPYIAFKNNKFKGANYEEFKAFVGSKRKKEGISNKKYKNYLYEKDINKYENMKDFIARNLVDTSYANRLVFNTLMEFFKDNGIDTKVHTVKGIATSAFRKRVKGLVDGLEKDREEDYSHHAIDALIVASIKKLNLYNKLLKDFSVRNKEVIIDNVTGEVILNENAFLDEKYIRFVNKLSKYKVKKYSHQIDTKPNRSVADQTIYSTRVGEKGEEVIKTYKDIYDPKFYALANDIANQEYQKYLMYRNDPKTFNKIIEIVNHYHKIYEKDKGKISTNKKGKIEFKFNPLKEHLDLTGEKITKYSNKNNGPIVNSMKYVDGLLGNHIDISKNYKVKNKKVILLQISPYRTDFYLDNGSYKFITVRYSNVRFDHKNNLYFIDEKWYEEEKEKKKISKDAKFCFSMHRNEIIKITNDGKTDTYKFTATNNDKSNVIEVKPINRYEKKQLMITIGKKTSDLRKHACTPLGDLYEVKNSILKLKFK